MQCDRRKLLQWGMLGSGSALYPELLRAEDSPILSKFPTSIMSAKLETASGRLEVHSGAVPEDLYGSVFMMEGIPIAEDHFSPAGKGAISRFDFNADGTVTFLRKMIESPAVILQDRLPEGPDQFKLLGGVLYFSQTLGFMDYCNTVPIPMGDNRFCMGFEGSMPHEFDGQTLDLVTPVGTPDEWITSLPKIASALTPKKWLFNQVRGSAHTYFDHRTSECFTVNYGGNVGKIGSGFIRLLSWDLKGRLQGKNVIGPDGKAAKLLGTGHSLGVTRNYIVIFDTATRVEADRILGFHTIDPQPHLMNIWIVRREDLRKSGDTVRAETVALDFDTSDIMVEYDDAEDVITMYGEYLSAADKSEPMYARENLLFGGKVRSDLSGYPLAPLDVGGLVRAAVQVKPGVGASEVKEFFKVIRDPELTWDMNDPASRAQFQFPDRFEHIYWSSIGYRPEHVVQRAADAYKNYKNRLYTNEDLPRTTLGSTILHQDCAKMAIVDHYQFPEHMIMRTLQFMEKKGDQSTDQTNGYIFCSVAVNSAYEENPTPQGKEIWIFDAQNLRQGPLCRLHHRDFTFATTNHAVWVPSVGPRPAGVYKASLYDYYNSRMSQHSSAVQGIVKNDIFPRFA